MTTTSGRATAPERRRSLLSDTRDFLARNRLFRSCDEQLLGGVCAGLGRRVQLRPGPARLVFVLVLMLLPGSQLIVYPVLWVLLPLEPAPAAGTARWFGAAGPVAHPPSTTGP